ncbi:21 kDa protein [Elaeis guineensis]|uniref:21 kDa protein n=1 Tax=Elaeis guineensis var. tenera TaxID=51953 RepID=A0A6I9RXZ7_ELAGV|nr:21 kDa protein [Elaeis guineensis]
MAVQNSTGISSCFPLAAFLTLILAFALDASTCHAARPNTHGTIGLEFIRTSCNKTKYPSLCFNSLAAYAPTIQTSPTQLAEASLSVSLSYARGTSTMMTRLSKDKGMSSREAEAISDCMESLGDSVDELKQSLKVMGHLSGENLKLRVNDIQTWVSSALTDENTCLDGFASNGMKTGERSNVRGRIVRVAQLTSNALSIISGLAPTESYSP